MGKCFFLFGVSQLPSVEMTRYPKIGISDTAFLPGRNLFWALFKHCFKQKLLQNRLHPSSSTTKIPNITKFPRVLYWNIGMFIERILLKESLSKEKTIVPDLSFQTRAESWTSQKTHPAPHPRFCASLEPPHFQKLQHPGTVFLVRHPEDLHGIYILSNELRPKWFGFQAIRMKQWVMCLVFHIFFISSYLQESSPMVTNTSPPSASTTGSTRRHLHHKGPFSLTYKTWEPSGS